jgi:5-methylcytosine-specific restriction endonuclease McrA
MRTLVLNSGYEPMQLISWQRALCLVLSSRAEVVASYHDQSIRTISTSYPMPSVVRLTRYVRLVQRFGIVKCSRRNIMLRDRYECQYCGIRCTISNATIDHILPVSRGGRMSWDNIVTACGDCNRKKGSRTPMEAGFALRSRPRRPSWREWLEHWQHDLDDSWLPYLELTG